MTHPDLPTEQTYVDHVYDCFDRARQALERVIHVGATEEATDALDAWATRRLQMFEVADRGLCFGRLDLDGGEEPVYVGRRWVHDNDQRVLLVNWQAPAARPFYTATPTSPHGVARRRRFRTRRRELLDIADEKLGGSVEDAVGSVDDLLLEELERSRDARMRDIVATIQADQYGLIARPPQPPLVVQGGPGTGKTAVGLHRASFLLYSHREETGRVLVVGPNPTFMEYVSHVLPALGEHDVVQRAVAELVEGVEATVEDSPDLQRLKADVRLAVVVRRAAELRLEPQPRELVVRLDGAFVGLREHEVAAVMSDVRASHGVSAAARRRFRMEVLRRFYSDYGDVLGGAARRSFDEVEAALRKDGVLTRFLDHVWPAVRAEALVRQVLTSRAALTRAAEGILDADEQRLLAGRRAGWSAADLPLVDEARAVVGDPPVTFGHVVVDEAQDLTPMQLRLVARRMRGSFTVLGDIAQATGPVPYDGWDAVLRHLPGGDVAERAELRHAYRVPRELMELALPLLERIAPDVAPPVAYRSGGAPPRIVLADPPLERAFAEAAALGQEEGLLAVILPASLRTGAQAGPLFDETRIPQLTPREAKGLEFDHVVVVEPAAIVEEAPAGQGLRELYVALTRATTSLAVVHARPLPEPLAIARSG